MSFAINFAAYNYNRHEGYPRMAQYLIRELLRLGISVNPMVLAQLQDMPAWMLAHTGFDVRRPTISLMPGRMVEPIVGRQWVFSMWEDTCLPDGWAERINDAAERLLVPAEWVADVFKSGGVDKPIHVVHGGTSPEDFPLIDCVPARSRPYTFIALADRGTRKGFQVVYEAFFNAFEAHEDVKLIVKINPRIQEGQWLKILMTAQQENDAMHKRIQWMPYEFDSMADLYGMGDCFVYPAAGDGWGMPPREAAMSGLPVICTNWSALEVGIDQWAWKPLGDFTMQQSMLHKRGRWAVPSVESVAAAMREAYEKPEEAKRFGLQAAQWLRGNQTWRHSAQEIVKLLERYG